MKLDSSYPKKYVLEELRKKGRGVKIIILSSNIIWAVYECDKRRAKFCDSQHSKEIHPLTPYAAGKGFTEVVAFEFGIIKVRSTG